MYRCPVSDPDGLEGPVSGHVTAVGVALEPPYEAQLGDPSHEVRPRCGFELGKVGTSSDAVGRATMRRSGRRPLLGDDHLEFIVLNVRPDFDSGVATHAPGAGRTLSSIAR